MILHQLDQFRQPKTLMVVLFTVQRAISHGIADKIIRQRLDKIIVFHPLLLFFDRRIAFLQTPMNCGCM